MSEDLSWLTHPLADSRAPKEQVGTTTGIATDIVTESSPQTTTPVPEHPAEREVTPSPTAPFIDIYTDYIVPSSVVVPGNIICPLEVQEECLLRGMILSMNSRDPDILFVDWMMNNYHKQLLPSMHLFIPVLFRKPLKKPSKNQSGSKL